MLIPNKVSKMGVFLVYYYSTNTIYIIEPKFETKQLERIAKCLVVPFTEIDFYPKSVTQHAQSFHIRQ